MTHTPPDHDDTSPSMRPDTLLVRAGIERTAWSETSASLALTSGYVYPDARTAAARLAGEEDGFVYSRYANPTNRMLEHKLALIEGAQTCCVTASGMAAVAASILAGARCGDRVVASSALFGSCWWIVHELLPRYGIETVFVNGNDSSQWQQALSQPTRFVLIETPSNPILDAVDIALVSGMAHDAGAQVIVDNVLASPVCQKPLAFGADWIVYSATKHIDGQGRVLGGAILGRNDPMDEIIRPYLRHTGAALSPFNGWVLVKALETLSVRVAHQTRTAAILADRLAGHSAIAQLRYPGRNDHPGRAVHARQMTSGGTLLAFSLHGGRAAAFGFLDALRLVDISNNLGDTRTLATHPATTTHRILSEDARTALGLDDSWVRVSVGLEDIDDLSEDMIGALNSV